MALQVFLLFLYATICIVLIRRLRFFKNSGLSNKFISALFVIKVILAIIYGSMQMYYYGYGDTFGFQRGANQIVKISQKDPTAFFELVFTPCKHQFPSDYKALNDGNKVQYYGHPRSYMVVRINAIIRLISFGFYNVHALFFAFLSLIGFIGIYKFFKEKIPDASKFLKLVLFFTPSLLFWGSGMHKEAVVILCLGLLLNAFRKVDRNKGFLMVTFLFAVLIFWNVRNYVLLLLLPPFLLYLLTKNWKKHIIPTFILTYLLGFFLFFNAKKISAKLDFPQKLVKVKDDFLSLKGRSNITTKHLEPTFIGFLKQSPNALINTFVRPFPTEYKTIYYAIAGVENLIVLLLILLTLLFWRKNSLSSQEKALLLFCVLFVLTYYVFLGLSVTNLGALARYKTLGLIFLLTTVAVLIDVKKIKRLAKQIPFLSNK